MKWLSWTSFYLLREWLNNAVCDLFIQELFVLSVRHADTIYHALRFFTMNSLAKACQTFYSATEKSFEDAICMWKKWLTHLITMLLILFRGVINFVIFVSFTQYPLKCRADRTIIIIYLSTLSSVIWASENRVYCTSSQRKNVSKSNVK